MYKGFYTYVYDYMILRNNYTLCELRKVMYADIRSIFEMITLGKSLFLCIFCKNRKVGNALFKAS